MNDIVPLTSEEQIARDEILRGKKRGVYLAFGLLVALSGVPLWVLQVVEQAAMETLVYTTLAMLALIALGAWCLRRFTRKIDLDLQSAEKIVTSGRIIRGWQVNARRDTMLTVEIDGKWLHLSAVTIKRLMDNVVQMNHLVPGDLLRVEMTPHGHILTKMEKI